VLASFRVTCAFEGALSNSRAMHDHADDGRDLRAGRRSGVDDRKGCVKPPNAVGGQRLSIASEVNHGRPFAVRGVAEQRHEEAAVPEVRLRGHQRAMDELLVVALVQRETACAIGQWDAFG
jgi:hypothetical protein